MKKRVFLLSTVISLTLISFSQDFSSDVFSTKKGDLKITFIGHASLMFEWNDLIIYADPVMHEADFTKFPDADLIFITHQHGDHLDKTALEALLKSNTSIVAPPESHTILSEMNIPELKKIREWEKTNLKHLEIEAVPAYNIEHKRPDGKPFHPKGMGVGYIAGFAGFKVLIGGDTEDIPEYKQLADYHIDAAFLPMNIPYTMTPEMVISATKMIQPKILYPYHYGKTDTQKLLDLLLDDPFVEVRIRKF